MTLSTMQSANLLGDLERIHPASFGWALWCCGHQKEEAEEVLQTAYLKVIQGGAQFNGNSSLRTWFFAVIRRTALEQRRRQWLRGQMLARWLIGRPAPDPATDPEAAASGSEKVLALRRAMAALAVRQQEVLHLVYYQDFTVEEAAGIMGVSLGTARTHFERGKSRLRVLLAQQEGRRDGQ